MIDICTSDLQEESSYVEDNKELYLLVSARISSDWKSGDSGSRGTIITVPGLREVPGGDSCVVTNEGFDYPEYAPTDEQVSHSERSLQRINYEG